MNDFEFTSSSKVKDFEQQILKKKQFLHLFLIISKRNELETWEISLK